MKTALTITCLSLCSVVIADPCPNLSGQYSCQLSINSSIVEPLEISQSTQHQDSLAYTKYIMTLGEKGTPGTYLAAYGTSGWGGHVDSAGNEYSTGYFSGGDYVSFKKVTYEEDNSGRVKSYTDLNIITNVQGIEILVHDSSNLLGGFHDVYRWKCTKI